MHKWLFFSLILYLSMITIGQPTPPITTENAGDLSPFQVISMGGFDHIDWSTDGNTLALATFDGIAAYDTQLQYQWQNIVDQGISQMFIAPDDQSILTLNYRGQLERWSIDGFALDAPVVDETINAATFTPSGDLITVGSAGILTRNLETGETLTQAANPLEQPASALAVNPAGTEVTIVSCSAPSMGGDCFSDQVATYTIIDGTKVAEIPLPDNTDVTEVHYALDGATLAISGYTQTYDETTDQLNLLGAVQFWDGGTVTATVSFPESRPVDTQFLPDGTLVVAAGEGISIIDQTGTRVDAIDIPLFANAFDLSTDGTQLAIAGGGVVIYDLTQREIVLERIGHNGLIADLATVPGTDLLVSSSWDGTARLWDLTTGTQLDRLDRDADAIYSDMEIVNNGSAMIIVTDLSLAQWAINPEGRFGAQSQDQVDVNSTIYSLEASRDGSVILYGTGDGTVALFSSDLSTNLSQQVAPSQGLIPDVAISPDNQRLAYPDREQLIVTDLAGNRLNTFPVQLTVQQTAFSPDGTLLASAGQELIVWDTTGGPEIHLSETINAIGFSSVAFSPDGSLIVAGSGDGAVRVFDVTTGTLLFENFAQKNIRAVAFTEDGTGIISGDQDGSIILWRIGDHALG